MPFGNGNREPRGNKRSKKKQTVQKIVTGGCGSLTKRKRQKRKRALTK